MLFRSEGVLVATRGSYLSTTRAGKVIAAVGVDDLVVIDTEDALLVARRDRAQDVRKAVEELKRRGLDAHL